MKKQKMQGFYVLQRAKQTNKDVQCACARQDSTIGNQSQQQQFTDVKQAKKHVFGLITAAAILDDPGLTSVWFGLSADSFGSNMPEKNKQT